MMLEISCTDSPAGRTRVSSIIIIRFCIVNITQSEFESILELCSSNL